MTWNRPLMSFCEYAHRLFQYLGYRSLSAAGPAMRRISARRTACRQALGTDRPYYRLKMRSTVGFITSMSDHFCKSCNRLRLTSVGGLRPCLYDSREIDLKTPLRGGAGLKEIAELIMDVIALKPDRHHMSEGWRDRHRVMSQIGG